MLRKRHIYFFILSIMIIATFTPWRPIAQGLPFVGVIISLIMDRPNQKLFKLIKPFLFLVLFGVISAVLNSSPIVNLLFGIITWIGGIAALIVAYLSARYVQTSKILKTLFFTSFVQIPIGLYQVFSAVNFQLINPFTVSGSIGDNFSGTLFLSGVNSHITGLKILFSLSLLFFIKDDFFRSKYIKMIYFTGFLVGWIMPSAVHSFLCFILGVLSYVILERGREKLKLLLIGIFSFTVILTLQEFVSGYVGSLVKRAIVIGRETPRKVIAAYETINLSIEKPTLPLLGLGLGRYSSYAAMSLSGEILKYQPWYIPISISEETDKVILPYWNKALLEKDPWAHGVANQPWFTYMSIYGELGLPGLASFVIFFLFVLRKLKFIKNRDNQILERDISKGLLIFTYFLLYLFFFDNWFEDARLMVPYFIILGFVFKKSEQYL